MGGGSGVSVHVFFLQKMLATMSAITLELLLKNIQMARVITSCDADLVRSSVESPIRTGLGLVKITVRISGTGEISK